MKTTRPLPPSGIQQFGQWLVSEDWSGISDSGDPDCQLSQYNEIISDKINPFFPKKNVKISNEDLPFIDWKLKQKSRELKRLYRKEGRKGDYVAKKCEFDILFLKA